jgi:zinc/manganese transport system permease protein
MFTGLMLNTWVTASIVAVIAGITGFFAVLRGSTFAAHAIPNGAFAGAAGASLLGINVIWGLAVFAVAGALGIGAFGAEGRGARRRHDGDPLTSGDGGPALSVSMSSQYAETYRCCSERYSASAGAKLPILGSARLAWRSALPSARSCSPAPAGVAEARGVRRRAELYFLS